MVETKTRGSARTEKQRGGEKEQRGLRWKLEKNGRQPGGRGSEDLKKKGRQDGLLCSLNGALEEPGTRTRAIFVIKQTIKRVRGARSG